MKLTIWSLIQKLVRYIKLPKRKECVAFSPDGNYLSGLVILVVELKLRCKNGLSLGFLSINYEIKEIL